MKHIIRKPILPLILICAVLFGSCFLSFYQKNMQEGYRQIDRLYEDTRLTFELLNPTDGMELELLPLTADRVAELEPIQQSCRVMECPYRFDEESGGILYGTDNFSLMAEHYGLRVEGSEVLEFHSWQALDCLMERGRMEKLGLSIGESFTLYPFDGISNGPAFTMQIIGTFDDPNGMLSEGAIVVSDYAFLSAPKEPKLLFNSNMMYFCYCRAFFFRIDPIYNREYETVQALVEDTLNAPQDFSVFTNARALEEAVKPLERKLNLQEMLDLPLQILFSAAVVIVAILLSLSLRNEIFLRLMWGEKRAKVFFKMLLSELPMFFVAGALACCLKSLDLRLMSVGIAACALTLIVPCGKNLVRAYGDRED